MRRAVAALATRERELVALKEVAQREFRDGRPLAEDPIFAARSETFGEAAFGEYSVPDAVLRFRQGFGRLIRTRSDRGVVAVFDRRIVSKQYGQMFLQSLPECTVLRGPSGMLDKAAREWMKRNAE